MSETKVARKLSRNETHDLGMIIKDRTKVLKAHAEEQAAAYMADFEKSMAAIYSFDQDQTWKAATAEAMKIVAEANEKVAARCRKMGIPKEFAPSLGLEWRGRGQNAIAVRRNELRAAAKRTIEAMTKAAITKIEKQALELRTQVVAMGILSEDGKMFLESLAPIDDAMRGVDLVEMEKKVIKDREHRRIGYTEIDI